MSRFERVVFSTSGCLNEEKPALSALIEWLQIKKQLKAPKSRFEQLKAPKSRFEEGGYGSPTFPVH
jgi:hypothetical protein